MAKLCSDKEIIKLKHAFLAIDKDNSGEIEYEEIPKIFKDLNIKASDVRFINILIFKILERIKKYIFFNGFSL